MCASLLFTIPKMLRKHFLFDRGLYGELVLAAYTATEQILASHIQSLEGAAPAMVAVPQSWGALIDVHPHLHALVSIGVFDRQGVFHSAPIDLDFAPPEEHFRERVVAYEVACGPRTIDHDSD